MSHFVGGFTTLLLSLLLPVAGFAQANAPHVRLAALASLVQSGGNAMPQLKEALVSEDSTLSAFAIESLRRLGTPQARAALREALPKVGTTRTILLGTLSELGDYDALQNLRSLAAGADSPRRNEAQRELSRLKYAAPASILDKLGGDIPSPDDVVQVRSSAYSPEVIQKRRAELAAQLSPGEKLLTYLDCGVVADAKDASDVAVRQLNGEAWVFEGADQVAAPTLGTVAFHDAELRYEISGLDPQKRYALCFTWWDYDQNGRSQSVALNGGQPAQTKTILPNASLPSYVGRRQIPTPAKLLLPPGLVSGGKVRAAFKKSSGPNVVLSELWLIETQAANSTPPGVAGVAATGAQAPTAIPAASASPTKVLIVTGQDYPAHFWRETAPALRTILEEDTRLTVRIVEDPHVLDSTTLTNYDVVLLHFQNWETPGPGVAARENLRRFVANGGGLVSVHFACGAWHGEWPEFQNLVGRVWHGSGPGKPQHDARGPFTVRIVDKDHAVTHGLSDFETDDELYTCLTGDAPIHIVADATSKVDKENHPMAFTRDYEKGRVFLTTLGHDVKAFTNSSVPQLIRQGCAWAAGAPTTK